MNIFPVDSLERSGFLVGARPEHTVIVADHSSHDGVAAEVVLAEHLGHEVQVVCNVAPDHRVVVRLAAGDTVPSNGSTIRIAAAPEHRHRFDATTGTRLDRTP